MRFAARMIIINLTAAFAYDVKCRLLHGKRPSFALQETAFCNTPYAIPHSR